MRKSPIAFTRARRYESVETEPGGGSVGPRPAGDGHGAAQPEQPHPKTRAFPFLARLKREDVMRAADAAEWHAEADQIAGPNQWYLRAGWKRDAACTLIGFATQAEADEMQRWIAASRIETRPAPARYDRPQLSVAGGKPS